MQIHFDSPGKILDSCIFSVSNPLIHDWYQITGGKMQKRERRKKICVITQRVSKIRVVLVMWRYMRSDSPEFFSGAVLTSVHRYYVVNNLTYTLMQFYVPK